MSQAEEEEFLPPALEDEAVELDCLLTEPKACPVSVDVILGCDTENSRKSMAIEDLPCTFGEMVSNTTLEREGNMKLGVPDEMLCEVDEVGDLQAGNGISNTCEDYLLDIEIPERVSKLDCNSTEEFHSQNPGSEHQIPGFSRSDNEILGIPKLSTRITTMLECQNDVLEKNTCEFQDTFSSKFEHQRPDKDKLWAQVSTAFDLENVKLEEISNFLGGDMSSNEEGKDMNFALGLTSESRFFTTIIKQNNVASIGDGGVEQESPTSFDLENVNELEDISDFLRGDMSSKKEEKDTNSSHGLSSESIFFTTTTPSKLTFRGDRAVGQESPSGKGTSTSRSAGTGKVGALLTGKRLRRATRRYIEESSVPKSRYKRGRREVSTCTKRDNFGGDRFQMTIREESFHDAGSHGDCSIEHASTVDSNSDNEHSTDESENDHIPTARSVKCGGQRKNHRPWNLSEVVKLIDGVSQHGVGRWTAIKRLLFSSSSHRTAVDLKDKWRNLLRASYSQKSIKREDEQNRKHAWRSLPKSVLTRVSELAVIHPYPRGRDFKSKLSHVSPTSSPTLPLYRKTSGTRT